MKPEFTAEQLQTTIRAMEAGGVKVMVSKLSLIHISGPGPTGRGWRG